MRFAPSIALRVEPVVSAGAHSLSRSGVFLHSPCGCPLGWDLFSTPARAFLSDTAGLKHWGKRYGYADAIHRPAQQVSQMLSGERVIYLRDALPILAEPDAATGFLGWGCKWAGLSQPRLLSEIVLSTEEARGLRKVRRRMGDMWKFFGAELARTEYECSLDLLDAAIDGSLLHLNEEK